MNILVVGASGKTGRLLVQELLDRGHLVKVVVRSVDRLPAQSRNHENLYITQAAILDLTDAELRNLVKECDAVASCLGHNMTWKGIYGRPRRLVTDTVQRICLAIQMLNPEVPVRFVLMNTTGNRNRDLQEKISYAEKGVIGLLRLLLPPHVDNEKAADLLRLSIGHDDSKIEWSAVRPDTLKEDDKVSPYKIFPSPIRSAIFNAGETSRINVAHFMADLAVTDLWQHWKGQMPVIYNQTSLK